ncbi:hypothetical protein ACJVC5_08440 [Peredibacter sp. HCB2-198]|uniref:hypothetical protein n=1 Tax=Peredibacter sp. HCB2-198 TaxID=3383025 RepID=UPI0038B67843
MLKLLLLMFTLLLSFGVYAEGIINSLNPFKQSSNVAVFCESAYENYRAGDNYVPNASQIRVEVPSTPQKLQDGDLINLVRAIKLYRGEKKDIVADCSVKANAKLQALNMSAVSSVVSYEENAELEADKVKQENLNAKANACRKLKEDLSCTPFDIDPSNTSMIQEVKEGIAPVTDSDGCKCIKEVMRQAEIWNIEKYTVEKNTTKDRMHDAILNGFGKKFLNDYAANMEDVGFFQVNAAKFFGQNKEKQISSAKGYECSDVSKYESAIDKKCSANGIDPEERQKRLNKIFNAYGNSDANDQLPLGQRFSKLNEKIQVLDEGSSPYRRETHDAKRFGLSRKEPSVILLDKFVRSFVADQKNSGKIQDALLQYGSPLGAIAEFMSEEAVKDPKEFVRKYLSDSDLNPDFVKKAKAFLTDKKIHGDVKYTTFVSQIEVAMGLHPGIKAIMTDNNVFLKATETANLANKPLVEALEMSDAILGKKYQERCEGLIEKLSEATCMKDDDILGKVRADDISTLLRSKGYPENRNYELLVSCEAGNTIVAQKPFNDLTMVNPYENSDLKDRLTKPVNEQKNAFRRLHDTKNEEVKEIVATAVEETKSQRQEVKDRSLASYKYSGNSEGQSEGKAEIAQVASAVTSSASSSPSQEPETSSFSANMTNFAATPVVLPTTVTTPKVAEAKSDLKSEVRETLSNKDNQEKVDRLLSNTDDSSMKELLRLKEESLKNRLKIYELTSESEKQKLKDLEEKIKFLETKKQQIAQAQAVEAEEELIENQQRNSFRAPTRDIASLRPMMDTSGSGSGDYSGGGSSTGGSFGSGGLAPSVGRGGSSAAASRSNVHSDKNADTSDGYIVVSSEGVSQGVKSQEVSQELINLLSSSDPDLSALKKLKDSGMLYKFKVMENGVLVEKEVLVDYKMLNEDAKKLVESKLATKQHLQIESELVAARRVHSFQSLKIILGEQLRK